MLPSHGGQAARSAPDPEEDTFERDRQRAKQFAQEQQRRGSILDYRKLVGGPLYNPDTGIMQRVTQMGAFGGYGMADRSVPNPSPEKPLLQPEAEFLRALSQPPETLPQHAFQISHADMGAQQRQPIHLNPPHKRSQPSKQVRFADPIFSTQFPHLPPYRNPNPEPPTQQPKRILRSVTPEFRPQRTLRSNSPEKQPAKNLPVYEVFQNIELQATQEALQSTRKRTLSNTSRERPVKRVRQEFSPDNNQIYSNQATPVAMHRSSPEQLQVLQDQFRLQSRPSAEDARRLMPPPPRPSHTPGRMPLPPRNRPSNSMLPANGQPNQYMSPSHNQSGDHVFRANDQLNRHLMSPSNRQGQHMLSPNNRSGHAIIPSNNQPHYHMLQANDRSGHHMLQANNQSNQHISPYSNRPSHLMVPSDNQPNHHMLQASNRANPHMSPSNSRSGHPMAPSTNRPNHRLHPSGNMAAYRASLRKPTRPSNPSRQPASKPISEMVLHRTQNPRITKQTYHVQHRLQPGYAQEAQKRAHLAEQQARALQQMQQRKHFLERLVVLNAVRRKGQLHGVHMVDLEKVVTGGLSSNHPAFPKYRQRNGNAAGRNVPVQSVENVIDLTGEDEVAGPSKEKGGEQGGAHGNDDGTAPLADVEADTPMDDEADEETDSLYDEPTPVDRVIDVEAYNPEAVDDSFLDSDDVPEGAVVDEEGFLRAPEPESFTEDRADLEWMLQEVEEKYSEGTPDWY